MVTFDLFFDIFCYCATCHYLDTSLHHSSARKHCLGRNDMGILYKIDHYLPLVRVSFSFRVIFRSKSFLQKIMFDACWQELHCAWAVLPLVSLSTITRSPKENSFHIILKGLQRPHKQQLVPTTWIVLSAVDFDLILHVLCNLSLP